MRVLVTGGAGFIGSHLVDELINKSPHLRKGSGDKVVVIDDLSLGKKWNVNPKAKFYKLDIQNNKVRDIFQKERFDVVFHLAAQINVRESVTDPLHDAKVNILGSLNLLINSQKYKIKKFIFASSGGVMYGNTTQIPTPESHPVNPISPYGISKYSIENYLNYYLKEYKLDYTVLRFSNVYGPRQNPEGEAGVVAIFITKLLAGKQPIINGSGKQTRDYLYVQDAVRATIMAFPPRLSGAGKNKGLVYNVGTGKETDVVELFHKILRIGRFKAKEKHGPPLKGEQVRSCLDYTKIKKDWGFSPLFTLEQGLEKTINWFKNQEK